MEKYKYPFYHRIVENKARERLKQLDKTNKRNYRIRKLLHYAFSCLYILLVGALIVLTIWISRSFDGVWAGLFIAFMFLMIIILPVVILTVLYLCLHKKIPSVTYKDITAETIKKITKPLVEYYKIPSDYVVTKCYSCTDVAVVNKDVILFVYDGKLRIVNDVFHSLKDFGCYEFEDTELTCFNIVEHGMVKTTIQTADCEFILGYRAKTFIKRAFES